MLHYLVTHADRLVTKDTLLDAVWPELAISDVVVRVAIGELRRALGDTAQAPRFIATVHRRGYRFVAPVVEHTEEVPSPPAPVPPASAPDAAGGAPHRLLCRHRRRNAATSPCCSAIWSIRLPWRDTWTRKTCARSCGPTIRPVPR